MIYRVAISLMPIKIADKIAIPNVFSENFTDLEKATNFAKALQQAKIALGWRVLFSTSKDPEKYTWYNHGNVSFIPDEFANKIQSGEIIYLNRIL